MMINILLIRFSILFNFFKFMNSKFFSHVIVINLIFIFLKWRLIFNTIMTDLVLL